MADISYYRNYFEIKKIISYTLNKNIFGTVAIIININIIFFA